MLRILYGRGEKKGKVKNSRIIKIFGRVVRITIKIFPKFLLRVEKHPFKSARYKSGPSCSTDG